MENKDKKIIEILKSGFPLLVIDLDVDESLQRRRMLNGIKMIRGFCSSLIRSLKNTIETIDNYPEEKREEYRYCAEVQMDWLQMAFAVCSIDEDNEIIDSLMEAITSLSQAGLVDLKTPSVGI